MQVEVTFLTRRGADAIMRRAQTVTGEAIRLGRGSDNEIQLADIRIGLHAAVLNEREGGLSIERAADEFLRINGASAASAAVFPNDKINIGPYEIVIAEPPEGFDAALTIELTQPLGDALERLMSQSRIGLFQAGWSRRRWSWVLFLLFAIVGLVLPIAVYPFGAVITSSKQTPKTGLATYISLSWNAGALSNPHRFFAQDCGTCHRAAFASVPDSACLSCHGDIGGHLAVGVDLGRSRHDLETTRCAECHEEHRGVRALVIRAEALCVDCHAELASTAPKAGIENVSGFPAGHPQFRATVVADAAAPRFTRVPLDGKEKAQDHSNLVFSHAAHLVPAGFLTPHGYKTMTCADCHVPEPSGQGFQPITFQGQCHSCHDLKFDADLPWREVPHGDVAAVVNAVNDFYARMALEGGVQDPEAPAFARRPVGTTETPSEAERRDALQWAKARADDAMTIIFDPKRGCAYCHVTGTSDGHLSVAPVLLRTRFLPEAQFDHAKHQALQCADCHDSAHSEKSSDVLVPGIESCVSCHGSERAALKAQSTCTSCHVFHRPEFGKMKTASAGQ
ncbi:MAG TPA: cytochrome c3 family protein [Stellaceae bacterium]|nr:cytochrome c3 family protein [Stellaceae bacterium]